VFPVMMALKEWERFCGWNQVSWQPRKGRDLRGRIVEDNDRRWQLEPLESVGHNAVNI